MATPGYVFTEARYGIQFGFKAKDSGWGLGHNQLVTTVGALLHCVLVSDTIKDPPSSPTAGDCYFVASGGTGAWQGHDGTIAAYQGGAWAFFPCNTGLRAYIISRGAFWWWSGQTNGWQAEVTSSGSGGGATTGGGYPSTFASLYTLRDGKTAPKNSQTFTRVHFPTVISDQGQHWDTANDWYVVPASGMYLIQALFRYPDDLSQGFSLIIGVGTSESDTPSESNWTRVDPIASGSTGRGGVTYNRIANCAAGDKLRMYVGSTDVDVGIFIAALNIIRIA